MDLVTLIEELVSSDSEAFFDGPADLREDLHVTARIAVDFHSFLTTHRSAPPISDITYVMDTIRSGMDSFFAVSYVCRGFKASRDTWNFEKPIPNNFDELRECFLRRFESLMRPEASAGERVADLLAITHLQIIFLAQNFPYVVLGDGS
jgi:hypothetical protein